MLNISLIFTSIQISLCGLIIILALIYSITVLFLRPVPSHIYRFTLNLSLAIICCTLFWMIYYILLQFYAQQISKPYVCNIILYIEMICTIQVPLALIIVSIHRLYSIVYYTKSFFKSKRWLCLCVSAQWMTGILISLPIFLNYSNCVTPLWKRIYMLIIIVIIPVLLCVIINSLIIVYVRASSRPIHPQVIINTNSLHRQHLKISGRDIRLLRYMIFMFVCFVGGWSGIYIANIIINNINTSLIISRTLSLIAEISLLLNIINLFVYNHRLRRYLKNLMLKIFSNIN